MEGGKRGAVQFGGEPRAPFPAAKGMGGAVGGPAGGEAGKRLCRGAQQGSGVPVRDRVSYGTHARLHVCAHICGHPLQACLYVWAYAHTCTRTLTRAHTCTRVPMHTHSCKHMCVHAVTHTCTCSLMHTRICAHTHAHACSLKHTRVQHAPPPPPTCTPPPAAVWVWVPPPSAPPCPPPSVPSAGVTCPHTALLCREYTGDTQHGVGGGQTDRRTGHKPAVPRPTGTPPPQSLAPAASLRAGDQPRTPALGGTGSPLQTPPAPSCEALPQTPVGMLWGSGGGWRWGPPILVPWLAAGWVTVPGGQGGPAAPGVLANRGHP